MSGSLLTVSVRQPLQPKPKVAVSGKPRIGFVCYCMGGGGVERWISSLISVTKDRFEWVGIGAEDFILERAKTQIGQVPFVQGVDACVAMGKKCDLLIVWLSSNVHRYKYETTAKLIGTHHSGPCDFTWRMNAKVHWYLLDGIHSCSEYARNAIPDAHRDRATVIHNCVDHSIVEPSCSAGDVYARYKIPRHRSIVTFIGRLSSEKRWGLVVAGGTMVDPYMSGILDAFSHRCTYTGWQRNVGDILQVSNVLVAPSDHHEACQYTVIEACLAGVPVITTPYGIVHDRPELATKVLPVNPTQVDIANAVSDTLSDTAVTRAKADLAQKIIEGEFNMHVWKRNWIKYLESFL